MEIKITLTFNVSDDCNVQKLSDILILSMQEGQKAAQSLLAAHKMTGVKILGNGATVDRTKPPLPDGI